MCNRLKAFGDTYQASSSNTIFADQLTKKSVHIINHEQHISMQLCLQKAKRWRRFKPGSKLLDYLFNSLVNFAI